MNTCSSCLGCDLQVFQTLSQPGAHVIFRTTLRGCGSKWCPYFTHEGAEIGRKRGLAQSYTAGRRRREMEIRDICYLTHHMAVGCLLASLSWWWAGRCCIRDGVIGKPVRRLFKKKKIVYLFGWAGSWLRHSGSLIIVVALELLVVLCGI